MSFARPRPRTTFIQCASYPSFCASAFWHAAARLRRPRRSGHRGPPETLLDPEVNLQFAGRYLRGAWIVADGDEAAAVGWYARGYYFAARDRCLLIATGLANRELC